MDLTRLWHGVCAQGPCKAYGVWETRGGPHAFLEARVMGWVALDRGLRLA